MLNIVTGSGSVVGATITEHGDVDAISFTGSSGVGSQVGETAAATGKRIQLEMGGKNPTAVMPSADVAEAASIVADGAFGVTGQACTATSRAIVHEAVYDDFVEPNDLTTAKPGGSYSTRPQSRSTTNSLVHLVH